MPHHIIRRHHLVAREIVGEIEQAADEELVGGDAFGRDRLAGAADRQPLRHEAALGADRHDHRVLDLLRLDETQHFGAEILRPVGPADAAARHLAEAQMHAFDSRRIDEDFVERPRRRQRGQLAALILDRDLRLRQTVLADLVEIGADRRLHGVDEVPQDAVLVEARHRLQRFLDLGGNLRLAFARVLRRRRADRSGRETIRPASPRSAGCARNVFHM